MTRASLGLTGDGLGCNSVREQILERLRIPTERLTVTEDPLELDTDYRILAGERALHAYAPDLQPGWVVGRPIIIGEFAGPVAMPVLHLDSYHRNDRWLPDLDAALDRLRRIAVKRAKNERWADERPETCVRCRGEFHYMDARGLAWCETHSPLRFG